MVNTESTIWAQHALTENGWQSDVLVAIDATGCISSVSANQQPVGKRVGILLPAMTNLHSHAFQRAMAGLTETRGSDPTDSFWTWRKLMYAFLERLTPDDVESIAAYGQLQMLESGYASVGEFHYLHHQVNGVHYTQLAEMCERIVAAAVQSGIGLTLLPVLYEQGGCDGRALQGGQLRFKHSIDEFANLYADAKSIISQQSNNFSIGIAPHSLRAVSQESLVAARELAGSHPLHIHVAEQLAEVEEIQSAWNARPVQWLLENHELNESWCLVHATQMDQAETEELAKSGAIVGLCPITESNLGDGIFNGSVFKQHGGQWGIGTDSNVRIALSEELRTLEYSQRLDQRGRAIFAEQHRSCGRVLFDTALAGQDQWLDAWLFANDDRLITDVWSAGANLVSNGMHIHHTQITQRYEKTLKSLVETL